jgi:hypothetical protein
MRKKTASSKTTKNKTVAQEIDEILVKLSHENFKGYIKELCIKDRNFRQQFLAQHATLVMPDSKDLYARQIKTILKTALGRSGYIGYSEARYVGNAIQDLVTRAEELAETTNYKTAMFIACAALEEMTKALGFADDSNGDIGGCIEYAVNILFTLSQQPIDDTLRKKLYSYCLKSWEEMIFNGWDWHYKMLDIAVELTRNDYEAKQIHSLLDEIKPNNTDWDWGMQEAQCIRVNLIRKTEGEEKASAFLEENLSNSDFRKEIIEKAIKEKDYNKVIVLSEEGINIDARDKPGLANDWRDYLLKVYIILNDTENIIKIARFQFLDSNHEKKRYFDILKKELLPENWGDFVQSLIKDITKNKSWIDYHLITQIYIWEEKWDKLLEVVQKNTSLQTLNKYEKYLLNDYSKELIDLYRAAVLKEMERATDRGHYQEICRYLRRMIKMGAQETVNSIIKQLQTTYPRRKALMEELLMI